MSLTNKNDEHISGFNKEKRNEQSALRNQRQQQILKNLNFDLSKLFHQAKRQTQQWKIISQDLSQEQLHQPWSQLHQINLQYLRDNERYFTVSSVLQFLEKKSIIESGLLQYVPRTTCCSQYCLKCCSCINMKDSTYCYYMYDPCKCMEQTCAKIKQCCTSECLWTLLCCPYNAFACSIGVCCTSLYCCAILCDDNCCLPCCKSKRRTLAGRLHSVYEKYYGQVIQLNIE